MLSSTLAEYNRAAEQYEEQAQCHLSSKADRQAPRQTKQNREWKDFPLPLSNAYCNAATASDAVKSCCKLEVTPVLDRAMLCDWRSPRATCIKSTCSEFKGTC